MTIQVSDHALVRFLARAGNYDVEPLRRQLQTAITSAAAAALALEQRRFTVKVDGMIFVVEDGVCVTIVAKSDKPFLLQERRA